jgi:hypothetical protein
MLGPGEIALVLQEQIARLGQRRAIELQSHPREGPLDDPSLGQILSKSSITPFDARTSRHVHNELIKSK